MAIGKHQIAAFRMPRREAVRVAARLAQIALRLVAIHQRIARQAIFQKDDSVGGQFDGVDLDR